MRLIFNAAGVLALYLSTTSAAHAIFSATVPEPETASLIIAGTLAAGGLRFLLKRKRDRTRDR
jgi:hypothetical protein